MNNNKKVTVESEQATSNRRTVKDIREMFREKEKTGGTGDTKEKYPSIVIKGINDNENAIRAEKESNNPKHEITKPTSKELFKKNGNKPENLEKKNSSAKNVPEKKRRNH